MRAVSAPTLQQETRGTQQFSALPLPRTTVSDSSTAIATAPGPGYLWIQALYAVNVSGSAVDVTVTVTPDGGSAFTVAHEYAVPTDGKPILLLQGLLLEEGDALAAIADTAGRANIFGYAADYRGGAQP